MKMVAAAKLRRAQDAVLQARPYAEKITDLLKNLSLRVSAEAHPLLVAREEKRVDLVLFTSDRGLCGGYNANLIRTAETFIRDKGNEVETRLILVGRKGNDYFQCRNTVIAESFPNVSGCVPEELAAEVAEKMIGRFLRGETDSITILYNRFRSALSQVPTLERLIPVATEAEPGAEAIAEYLFEPGLEALLGGLLPKVVGIGISRALREATASEHAARMTAMDAATTNAAEMIGRLTLQMNRARQASITTELLEVVSTAEALK
jgi:F-type H+-transporting ATPase subunit gamma